MVSVVVVVFVVLGLVSGAVSGFPTPVQNAFRLSAFDGAHDVAIINVSLSANEVYPGVHDVEINVVVKNDGDYTERFNVTVYANGTSGLIGIDTYDVASLGSSDQIIIPFVWNTAGVSLGNYTIVANASIVPGETNAANNVGTGGSVLVRQDDTAPVIGVPVQSPMNPPYVTVAVTDPGTGVDSVILSYSVDSGVSWSNVSMYGEGDGRYSARGAMPYFDIGTNVSYKIFASDRAGNQAIRDHAGNYYVFTVIIPEFPLFLILPLFMIAPLPAVIVYRRKTSK
jgi:hypothetical protein